jgi:hypothetical protein
MEMFLISGFGREPSAETNKALGEAAGNHFIEPPGQNHFITEVADR